MLVAVSVDMEGASQLRSMRETFGCMPEYWETGKPRLEADVAAACEGLLAGGATELVVLDNHGGNTVNVSPESLPPGARLETWHVYDLREHGVDAMFQVGYHARGGVDGFLSHTYVPGLRLRVGDELISESHGEPGPPRCRCSGSSATTCTSKPGLARRDAIPRRPAVHGRDAMRPVFDGSARGFEAIRAFAQASCRTRASAKAIVGPSEGHVRGEHAERPRRRRGHGRRRLGTRRRGRVRCRARRVGVTRAGRSPPQ